MEEPSTLYETKIRELESARAALLRREDLLSWARMGAFGLGVWIAYQAFQGDLSASWLALPILLFFLLVVFYQLILSKVTLVDRRRDYYQKGNSRMGHQWMGQGNTQEFSPPTHPHSRDLELFGPGSLYELLCTARTQVGERTLAKWILETPDIPTIRVRQQAVEELKERVALREDLWVIAADVRAEVHSDSLIQWGHPNREPVGKKAWIWPVALVLSLSMVVALLGFALLGWGLKPVFAIMVIQYGFSRLLSGWVREIVADVSEANQELGVLSGAFARFEKESFESTELKQLGDQLLTGGKSASQCIRKLDLLVSWLEARRNQLFAPVAILLLWDVHFAFLINRWREVYGERLAVWMDALGELETLSALACFAFEHQHFCVPEISESENVLEATQIGHPLMAEDQCVRNNVHLSQEKPVWIISGSNMSGKSTLLRSVGTNVILAQMGAPVCAQSFRMGRTQLGASIRVFDSLMSGTSRFYAEVKHLGELVQLAGAGSLLFLIDEIFSGTNSHDRRKGTEALIKGFIDKGALGMLTTHDLELTKISEKLSSVVNVHFEDRFEGGELKFDYTLRPGVVQRSNAIEIMRSVGLPV